MLRNVPYHYMANKTKSSAYASTLVFTININPLKCSGVRELHLEVFNAIQVWATF